MVFNEDQINDKKNKKILINRSDKNNDEIYFNDEYNKKYEFFNTDLEVGQFFLYEKVKHIDSNTKELFYPKLAIYLDCYTCDQTLEIEYKDIRRTWEHKTKYKYLFNDKEYTNYVSEIQGVSYTILWDENIQIYGVWDKKPDWKELKKAFKKSLTFRRTLEEEREIKLKGLID